MSAVDDYARRVVATAPPPTLEQLALVSARLGPYLPTAAPATTPTRKARPRRAFVRRAA